MPVSKHVGHSRSIAIRNMRSSQNPRRFLFLSLFYFLSVSVWTKWPFQVGPIALRERAGKTESVGGAKEKAQRQHLPTVLRKIRIADSITFLSVTNPAGV